MSPSGKELRRTRGDGWGMKHALPFLRSLMLASGMIYEEVGRSASTSKGRPARAGRMLSTASLNTARYASTVPSSFAVFVLLLRRWAAHKADEQPVVFGLSQPQSLLVLTSSNLRTSSSSQEEPAEVAVSVGLSPRTSTDPPGLDSSGPCRTAAPVRAEDSAITSSRSVAGTSLALLDDVVAVSVSSGARIHRRLGGPRVHQQERHKARHLASPAKTDVVEIPHDSYGHSQYNRDQARSWDHPSIGQVSIVMV
ncbi:hypothetical protein MRX96_044739 [Rhipicephalus microplus]